MKQFVVIVESEVTSGTPLYTDHVFLAAAERVALFAANASPGQKYFILEVRSVVVAPFEEATIERIVY